MVAGADRMSDKEESCIYFTCCAFTSLFYIVLNWEPQKDGGCLDYFPEQKIRACFSDIDRCWRLARIPALALFDDGLADPVSAGPAFAKPRHLEREFSPFAHI